MLRKKREGDSQEDIGKRETAPVVSFQPRTVYPSLVEKLSSSGDIKKRQRSAGPRKTTTAVPSFSFLPSKDNTVALGDKEKTTFVLAERVTALLADFYGNDSLADNVEKLDEYMKTMAADGTWDAFNLNDVRFEHSADSKREKLVMACSSADSWVEFGGDVSESLKDRMTSQEGDAVRAKVRSSATKAEAAAFSYGQAVVEYSINRAHLGDTAWDNLNARLNACDALEKTSKKYDKALKRVAHGVVEGVTGIPELKDNAIYRTMNRLDVNDGIDLAPWSESRIESEEAYAGVLLEELEVTANGYYAPKELSEDVKAAATRPEEEFDNKRATELKEASEQSWSSLCENWEPLAIWLFLEELWLSLGKNYAASPVSLDVVNEMFAIKFADLSDESYLLFVTAVVSAVHLMSAENNRTLHKTRREEEKEEEAKEEAQSIGGHEGGAQIPVRDTFKRASDETILMLERAFIDEWVIKHTGAERTKRMQTSEEITELLQFASDTELRFASVSSGSSVSEKIDTAVERIASHRQSWYAGLEERRIDALYPTRNEARLLLDCLDYEVLKNALLSVCDWFKPDPEGSVLYDVSSVLVDISIGRPAGGSPEETGTNDAWKAFVVGMFDKVAASETRMKREERSIYRFDSTTNSGDQYLKLLNAKNASINYPGGPIESWKETNASIFAPLCEIAREDWYKNRAIVLQAEVPLAKLFDRAHSSSADGKVDSKAYEAELLDYKRILLGVKEATKVLTETDTISLARIKEALVGSDSADRHLIARAFRNAHLYLQEDYYRKRWIEPIQDYYRERVENTRGLPPVASRGWFDFLNGGNAASGFAAAATLVTAATGVVLFYGINQTTQAVSTWLYGSAKGAPSVKSCDSNGTISTHNDPEPTQSSTKDELIYACFKTSVANNLKNADLSTYVKEDGKMDGEMIDVIIKCYGRDSPIYEDLLVKDASAASQLRSNLEKVIMADEGDYSRLNPALREQRLVELGTTSSEHLKGTCSIVLNSMFEMASRNYPNVDRWKEAQGPVSPLQELMACKIPDSVGLTSNNYQPDPYSPLGQWFHFASQVKQKAIDICYGGLRGAEEIAANRDLLNFNRQDAASKLTKTVDGMYAAHQKTAAVVHAWLVDRKAFKLEWDRETTQRVASRILVEKAAFPKTRKTGPKRPVLTEARALRKEGQEKRLWKTLQDKVAPIYNNMLLKAAVALTVGGSAAVPVLINQFSYWASLNNPVARGAVNLVRNALTGVGFLYPDPNKPLGKDESLYETYRDTATALMVVGEKFMLSFAKMHLVTGTLAFAWNSASVCLALESWQYAQTSAGITSAAFVSLSAYSMYSVADYLNRRSVVNYNSKALVAGTEILSFVPRKSWREELRVRFFNSAALKTLLWDNNFVHMLAFFGAYISELNDYALEQKLAGRTTEGGIPLSRVNVGREFSYESSGWLPVGWWHLLPAVWALAKLIDVIRKKHALGNEIIFQEIISNKMFPEAFKDYYRGHKDPIFSKVFPGEDYGSRFAELVDVNQQIQTLKGKEEELKGESKDPRSQERARAITSALLANERELKTRVEQAESMKERIERSLVEESNKTSLILDFIEMLGSFCVVSGFSKVLSKYNSLAELPSGWEREVLSDVGTASEKTARFLSAPYTANASSYVANALQPAGRSEALRRLYEARTEQFGGFSSFNVTLDRSYDFSDVRETISLLPYVTDYWGINYAVPTVSAFGLLWALKSELVSAFNKWNVFFNNQISFREEWLRRRELGNLLLRQQTLSTEYKQATFTEEGKQRLDEIIAVLGEKSVKNK